MGLIFPTKDVETIRDQYVLGKEKCDGSSHFLRIKIPNGRLNVDQFKEIASLSKEYGRGYAEITDRQNVQLHWIDPQNALAIFSRLQKIGFSTDHGGQGIPTAHGGDVRAIVSCPSAGIDKHELIDAWPIVKQIDGFFNGNRNFLDLPRKLKISISTCELNCGNPEMQDLAFVAVKQPSGKVGFAVFVGGTIAAVPQLAKPLNVIVQPDQILLVARCVAEIFRDYGSREAKAKARFRWIVEAWGTDKLREAIEKKMGKTLERYRPEHLPTCKGEHVGVQPQKQQGYSYINVPIVSGVLSDEKILKIAQIASKFGNGELRLTPFQNIILAYIPDAAVNGALKSLEENGYPLANAYLKWTTVACAGNFCGKTIDHPKNRAKEAVKYLDKRFNDDLKNAKLRISFSGCPNGCARHLIADIGLQGMALVSEGKSIPGYNLYIRANSGSTANTGKLIQRGIKAQEANFALANLVDAYLKNESNGTFNEFCSRKSVEELQAIIISGLR